MIDSSVPASHKMLPSYRMDEAVFALAASAAHLVSHPRVALNDKTSDARNLGML
jgi:hypothetical protein